SDATTATNRPKLTVTWSQGTSSTSTTSTTAANTTTTSTSTTTAPPTTTTLPGGSTTRIYQAGVSGPAGSASVDTNIRLSTPTTAWGSDPNLYIGVTNGATKVYRTLIAFDLSDIPAGAVVTSCRLSVNVAQRTS